MYIEFIIPIAPTTNEIAAIPTKTNCITPRTSLICSKICVAVTTWKFVSSLFLSSSFSTFSCNWGISEAVLTCAIIASTSSGLLNISRAVSKGILIWLSSWEFPISFNTPTILNSFPLISILFPNLNVLSNISFITLEPTIASYLSPSLINLPSSNSVPESKKNPSKFSTGIPLTNVNPTSFLYLTSVERNIPGTTYSNPDIFSTVSTSSIVNPSEEVPGPWKPLGEIIILLAPNCSNWDSIVLSKLLDTVIKDMMAATPIMIPITVNQDLSLRWRILFVAIKK